MNEATLIGLLGKEGNECQPKWEGKVGVPKGPNSSHSLRDGFMCERDVFRREMCDHVGKSECADERLSSS